MVPLLAEDGRRRRPPAGRPWSGRETS